MEDEEKRKKEEVEQEKLRRKAVREARKAEKEKEPQEKRTLHESRRAQQAVKEVNARSKRSVKKMVIDKELFAESELSSTDENTGVDCCPECRGSVDSNSCDKCEQWYHVECTSIPLSSYGIIDSIDWACQSCCTQV